MAITTKKYPTISDDTIIEKVIRECNAKALSIVISMYAGMCEEYCKKCRLSPEGDILLRQWLNMIDLCTNEINKRIDSNTLVG